MSYHFATIILQTLFKHCSAKFDGEKKRLDTVTRRSGNLDINIGIAKTLYFNFINVFEVYTTIFFVVLSYSAST